MPRAPRACDRVKAAWQIYKMPYLRWPGLEDVDARAIPLKSGPEVPVGKVLFSFVDNDPSQLNMINSERDLLLCVSRVGRLPDVGEDESITQGVLGEVMDSEQLGRSQTALLRQLPCPRAGEDARPACSDSVFEPLESGSGL
jgi:hypothetical protein